MSTFQAVWPITDPGMPYPELFEEARRDLPAVASRHQARITGEPHFEVRAGRRVPGSNGAAFVVTCSAPAEAVKPRDYGRPHPLGAAAPATTQNL